MQGNIVKIFNVEKADDGSISLRINDGRFKLEPSEANRLIVLFDKALNMTSDFPFPDVGYASYIAYNNGVVAVAISISRLDKEGSQFIAFVTHMKPGTAKYETDQFFMMRHVVEKFIETLK